MVCGIRENSLSCILADDTLATTLSLSGFRLNRTVLGVHGQAVAN
jgi:hypothetical protein